MPKSNNPRQSGRHYKARLWHGSIDHWEVFVFVLAMEADSGRWRGHNGDGDGDAGLWQQWVMYHTRPGLHTTTCCHHHTALWENRGNLLRWISPRLGNSTVHSGLIYFITFLFCNLYSIGSAHVFHIFQLNVFAASLSFQFCNYKGGKNIVWTLDALRSCVLWGHFFLLFENHKICMDA